ncbi:hypothetical protein ACHAXR_010861 [Thalassiosira sp. AJA248-18]
MNTFYIQAILTASLGGILYGTNARRPGCFHLDELQLNLTQLISPFVSLGYDMGVISGALPLLSTYFQLTPSQEEWIVSLLYFGGGVGAASGGFICDWRGRKFAILFTDVMFGLGAFLLYSAQTVESVMIGRLVVGWAVAVSGIADVAYLHEISSVWEEGDGACDSERGGPIEDEADGPETDAVVMASATYIEGDESQNKTDQETGGRGSVVSVNEACISLGFLLAFAVAYVLDDSQQNVTGGNGDGEASEEWRAMFAFGGFLAALQFFGMLFMPESPVWLHGKGRINDAVSAQNKIRGIGNTSDSESEIDHHRISVTSSTDTSSQHMQNHSEPDQSQSIGIEMSSSFSTTASIPAMPQSTSENSSSSFAEEEQLHTPTRDSKCFECLVYLSIKIRSIPSQIKAQYQQLVQEFCGYKRQCAIAFFLAASQQFCGHPSVLGYSAEIFAMLNQSSYVDANDDSGQEHLTPIELTVGIGLLKFVTTCIVILYVEKGGRVRWLCTGMTIILLSLSCLCISFMGRNGQNIADSSDNVQQQTASSFKNGLGIIGIYGVAVGYAASYGPLTWLITSELFPSSIRGRALGFATIITYMAAGLVSRTFLSLQESLGLAACFALYWTATIISILLVWLGVPDTGGEKTPEQIEREMNDLWRNHSRCPLFLRQRSRRSGERHSSLGNYGSWDRSNDGDLGNSPDPSSEEINAGTSSSTIVPPPVVHSGLTPRRSTSITKEII